MCHIALFVGTLNNQSVVGPLDSWLTERSRSIEALLTSLNVFFQASSHIVCVYKTIRRSR